MVLSRYVGAEVKRKEDPRLITGSSMYVDDLQLPGMAHVALYRSPYPHANIRRIDTSAAEAMPGVIAVVTGDQLAEFCGPMAAGQGEGASGEKADFDETEFVPSGAPTTWALARGKVRNTGEAIVAVVAVSRYQAEDAVAAIDVDFELLPNVTNPEDAMKPGAPLVFEHIPFNVGARWDRTHGDPDAAFSNAPVVARGRIRSQRVSGVPMEPRAVAAAPDPLIQGLTLWTSTQ
ncbi:MAG: xanthine dehydrogenase family protein molybdopterin-binding subunit, partial [Thermomicrobiales bacterium]